MNSPTPPAAGAPGTGSGRARPSVAGHLLRDITYNSLDPGYYAARRASVGRPPGRSRRWLLAPVVAAIAVAGLLAGGAVAQLRTSPPGSGTRDALTSQIDERTEVADDLAAGNLERRQEIERLEAEVLAESGAAPARAVEILAVPAAAVPVTGPGVRVTLQDSAGGSELFEGEVDPELVRVLDVDLQQVVNGLWAAGAEAVAINGQRLTTLSAIRSAGSAILVDYRPLAPPYVVEAIGDPQLLTDEVTVGLSGGFLEWLRTNYRVEATVETEESLGLPAASSVLLDHARPYRPTPASDGTAADAPGSRS
ncbi:MAG: DUF881 domain-containing protein [Kineosporiaceae bacterium]